jgi:hypothetical protein
LIATWCQGIVSAGRSTGDVSLRRLSRLFLFSIDTLVDMLARAGIHIDLVFSAERQGAA